MDETAIDAISGAAIEAAGADAAAKEAKLRRRVAQTGSDCRNCGATLSGRFCSACGQSAVDLHRPFWALLMDALEGLFSFDGRFWRTAPLMLWRPAHVTRLFLDGARARFVQPFRLFLFAILAFFLIFSLVSGDATKWFEGDDPALDVSISGLDGREEELARARDQLDEAAASVAGAPAAEGLEIAREAIEKAAERASSEDPAQQAARKRLGKLELKCGFRRAFVWEEPDPAICAEAERLASVLGETLDREINLNVGERALPRDVRERLAHNTDIAIDQPDILVASILRQAPKAVFAIVPVYALTLALMHFWRRKIYLYDHLIVALQFHTFLLFSISILMLVGAVVGGGWLIGVFIIWSNFILYRLHRHVYGHGRISSVLRTLILDFAYIFIFSAALVGLFLVGVAFI